MAYASTTFASPTIHTPQVTVPKLRWPRLSQRTRSLLMMGIMISPAFLSDQIGYCVERLFMTPDQIAVRQVPDRDILSQVSVFHVACVETDTPAAEQQRWAEVAAQKWWVPYPEAGPGCFKPDRAMYGIVGLKTFGVACPTAVLSVADHRQWVAFAANHKWAAYPQAGLDCVDP